MKKTKISSLQALLMIVYVVALLIATILAGKQFALPFNVVLGGGILCFPITYMLSDVFSEVYGYKWSRRVCYIGFAMTLFMVLMFELAIKIPYPVFWGNQEAFATVLGNAPRILIASLLALIVGDLANDIVFAKMKRKHANEINGFWARSLLSSFVGNVVDSLVFIPIAFIGQMPVKTLLTTMLLSGVSKTIYEVLFFPATRFVVKKVSVYENA
jgi:uncharacterized integral membrane protein (TIGR00697 family)